jgi:hypothetical protein
VQLVRVVSVGAGRWDQDEDWVTVGASDDHSRNPMVLLLPERRYFLVLESINL